MKGIAMSYHNICIYLFLFCTPALQALQQHVSRSKIDSSLSRILPVAKATEKPTESKQNKQLKQACHLEGLAGEEPEATCLLRDFLKTLSNYTPKNSRKFGSHGYLFFGPPGTGKSKSAQSIAQSSGSRILIYNVAATVKLLSHDPHIIDEIYKKAKELLEQEGRPVLIVFDDVRNEDNQKDVLLILNSYIDEYFNNPYIVTVFTLNQDIKKLDPGLLNRCQAVEWELPDEENRLAIITLYANRSGSSLIPEFLRKLVALSQGWSGREIESAFRDAKKIMAQNKAGFLEQAYVFQAFASYEKKSVHNKSSNEKPPVVGPEIKSSGDSQNGGSGVGDFVLGVVVVGGLWWYFGR